MSAMPSKRDAVAAAGLRLLSDDELRQLSPSECAAWCEQLDLGIVDTLQQIDADFAAATRTVAEGILPAVEEYGRSSKEIWDSVRIWKTFFEAAAGIRLAPEDSPYAQTAHYEEEDAEGDITARAEETVREANDASIDQSRGDAGNNIENDDDDDKDDSSEATFIDEKRKDAKPPSPVWADQASPFEQLRQDIQKVHVSSNNNASAHNDASYASSAFVRPVLASAGFGPSAAKAGPSAPTQAPARNQIRLRDLSMDSPDIVERPRLVTTKYDGPRGSILPRHQQPDPKGKARAQEEQDYRNHRENPSPFFKDGLQEQPTPSTIGSSFDLSSIEPPSPRPPLGSRQSSGNTAKKQLLQKVLTKNFVGRDGRPNASTPARKSIGRLKAAGADFFPTDLPSGWNGIADLSKTPLSSYDSPQKSTISRFSRASPLPPAAEQSAPDSVASAASYSSVGQHTSGALEYDSAAPWDDFMRKFNPPANSLAMTRLSKTPAKEAARLVTRDVLRSAGWQGRGQTADIDSPVFEPEPPSVVKNWVTRGFAQPAEPIAPSPSFADSPAHISRISHQQPVQMLAGGDDEEADSFEAEFDDAPPLPPAQPNFRHLADEGDELGLSQGAVIGSTSARQQASGAVGDTWEDSFEEEEEEEGASFDDPQPPAGYADQVVPLKDEGDSFDSNASRSFGDGEEETLFGAQKRQRESEAFRLNGPDDMVTLHGGKLLESQPFEASPLAGRDARHGL